MQRALRYNANYKVYCGKFHGWHTLGVWKYLHTAECGLALVGSWTSRPAGRGSAKGASTAC